MGAELLGKQHIKKLQYAQYSAYTHSPVKLKVSRAELCSTGLAASMVVGRTRRGSHNTAPELFAYFYLNIVCLLLWFSFPCFRFLYLRAGCTDLVEQGSCVYGTRTLLRALTAIRTR